MSAKQAISDKLQGSVAIHLRSGGVVNNEIKKGLLLSLSAKKKIKSLNIGQSYTQERGCFVHFMRLANTLLKDTPSNCCKVINRLSKTVRFLAHPVHRTPGRGRRLSQGHMH